MTTHISVAIADLLRTSDDQLNSLFQTDAGDSRQRLLELQRNGDRYVRAGECDNFCPLEGCQGHGEGVVQKSWLNSSNLDRARYHPETQVITLTFKNRNIYEYENVPIVVWAEFINAPSGGSYLAKNIAKSYPATKIA